MQTNKKISRKAAYWWEGREGFFKKLLSSYAGKTLAYCNEAFVLTRRNCKGASSFLNSQNKRTLQNVFSICIEGRFLSFKTAKKPKFLPSQGMQTLHNLYIPTYL